MQSTGLSNIKTSSLLCLPRAGIIAKSVFCYSVDGLCYAKTRAVSVVRLISCIVSHIFFSPSRTKNCGIEYQFYQLAESLSQVASYVLKSVLEWSRSNGHKYETIKIVKAIFPKLEPALEQELNKFIQSGDDQKLSISISILQYYGGEIGTYNLCKEFVKVLHEDSKFLSEVNTIIINTGVVADEFGLMKAYETKSDMIKNWIGDSNQKVNKFAENIIQLLEKQILAEKKRVEECIELEKHRYGSE